MTLKFRMKAYYFCIKKVHNTPIIVSFISLYDIPIIDTKPSGQIPMCNNYNASKDYQMVYFHATKTLQNLNVQSWTEPKAKCIQITPLSSP